MSKHLLFLRKSCKFRRKVLHYRSKFLLRIQTCSSKSEVLVACISIYRTKYVLPQQELKQINISHAQLGWCSISRLGLHSRRKLPCASLLIVLIFNTQIFRLFFSFCATWLSSNVLNASTFTSCKNVKMWSMFFRPFMSCDVFIKHINVPSMIN